MEPRVLQPVKDTNNSSQGQAVGAQKDGGPREK